MRERYLYETKNAGVGAAGPNRDLYQERLELSGIAGTTYEPYQRRSHQRMWKELERNKAKQATNDSNQNQCHRAKESR